MFIQEITKIKNQIKKRLESFFSQKIKEAKRIDPVIAKTAQYLTDQTLNGGKRIRAALAVQGYLSGGEKINPAIYDIGAAMELIHSYFLIHDDIIDQDDLRRGRPSMHCRFSNSLSKNISPVHRDHLGQSLAILAGDISSVWAYELFTRSNFPDKQKIRALEEMNQMIFKCGAGEILDVAIELKNHPKASDIFKVQFYKTASYTIESPLAIGAILGGAKSSAIKSLRAFARPLGIAFQIQDDILGIFGNEQEIGKPVGSDLRQGKMTLLML
ncbi:MAG: polyprenyl synthetase family protein, partial [Patescibacteria group bacterium]